MPGHPSEQVNPRLLHQVVLGLMACAALVLTFLVAAAPAQAASRSGHDISWPQCSTAEGGYGLPLPPASSQFVIIGLTKGLAFTENPCLAAQVSWAQTNSKPAQAYTMAGFPTSAQLASYRTRGPWAATTRAGQLSNVGYAEAAAAVASLAAVGFRPPVVWIDVEPRPAQPWPTATATQQRENRFVIEGLMRGLRDAGFAYGLYSFTSGWQSITGSWLLPGVPVWATAGRLDYPNEALDRCTQPSFSGGHVYISQWYDDTRDYDITCDPYVFTALAMPGSTLSGSTGDFNGDWNNDVLSRTGATGELRLYAGNGRAGFAAGVRIGSGWAAFNAVDTVGDFSGDGRADVLARETSTGFLWLYPGNGRGGWLPRVRVGSGWNIFNAVFGPGDFNGDQKVDVLARETTTGVLWLYPGNGRGGWLPRIRAGSGWNNFNTVLGPGDVNGDGTADVLARETSTGALWLYPGNGAGGWLPRVKVGTGWNGMTYVLSPGDLNGDRTPDVLARDGSGTLWFYGRNGNSSWFPRVAVGQGWNSMNAIF
ncbi:FG-GAP-like repeat-containing protein [Specibacter sp. RAF43]